MLRLAAVLFSLISPTLMGVGIVAVLVAGYGTMIPILVAAAVGFVIALPVTWQVTRAIY
nr:CTP synthetase [Rhodovulum sp. P5]